MTTEKWQLYSQAGVDGPEYGIRIRPGYTVVGFQLEDAQAIVAWQNTSIQPEGDILERANATLEDPDPTCGWTGTMIDLIAEVEWLRSKEAHYQGVEDWYIANHLYEKYRSPGDALAGEIERLRSQSVEQVFRKKNEELAAKDTRIKELVAEKRRLEARVEYCHDQTKLIELFEAAFLKAQQCPTCKGEGTIHPIGQPIYSICPKCLGDPESMAREKLERIKAGGKDEL